MKVWPRNDSVRLTLRHPTAGAFRAEGPADWPDDTFTYRRIQDGDITLLAEAPPAPPKPAPAEPTPVIQAAPAPAPKASRRFSKTEGE